MRSSNGKQIGSSGHFTSTRRAVSQGEAVFQLPILREANAAQDALAQAYNDTYPF
jgi:hypothetical protein